MDPFKRSTNPEEHTLKGYAICSNAWGDNAGISGAFSIALKLHQRFQVPELQLAAEHSATNGGGVLAEERPSFCG